MFCKSVCMFSCLYFYTYALSVTKKFEKQNYGLNSCLEHFVIGSYANETFVWCGSKCIQEVICKSFTYATVTSTCTTYSKYLTSNSAASSSDLYFVPITAQQDHVPSSCMDILAMGITTDGEYWLYPNAWDISFGRIKIYCHGLTTGSPQEYVTLLPDINFMTHGYNIYNAAPHFTVVYSKIKVNIMNMTVVSVDQTFASQDNTLGYGYVDVCSYDTSDSVMDTTSTGLIIDPNMQWYGNEPVGYMTGLVRDLDNRKVTVTCLGQCGHCRPVGAIQLVLNVNEPIPTSEATLIQCE